MVEANLVCVEYNEDVNAKDAIGVVKTRTTTEVVEKIEDIDSKMAASEVIETKRITAIEHEQHVHKYEIDCVGLMFVLMFYLSLQI